MVHHLNRGTDKAIFENRYDAGNKLATKLTEYQNRNVVVMAIPNGGVPIGLGVALALGAELGLVISRKIPFPLRPEGGFGAVTDDGTIILNDEAVRMDRLTEQQINYQVSKVRADIRQRSLVYHREKRPVILTDRTAIVIDDGLASGYTMIAAVQSLRSRRPREIIAAVPVSSVVALGKVSKVADKVITYADAFDGNFYVADFYRYWNEPDEKEVLQCLKEWRIRRSQSNGNGAH